MVRLINKDNMKHVTNVVCFLMKLQSFVTHVAEYNNPGISPCIYAMWHENQFSVYGLKNKGNTNILISNSIDGEIIASAVEMLGFKTCRGSSQRKGAVAGTLKLISKIKEGEDAAIMVDGPRGPLHKVKSGVIVLARETGVPIVPQHWYSEDLTYVKFPSWDKMTSPVGPCRLMNIYGEPIYVEGKTDEQVAEEIKSSLLHLQQIAPAKYKEAKRLKLWRKKK